MAVTINADNGVVSGSAGLKESADSTGVLALQTNGTTAVSISTGQVVTLTNALAEASGGTGTTVGYNGFKNRIINGGMVIDQRNAGASVTVSSNQYTLDRFRSLASGGGAYSVVQSSTAPTGFSTSMLMTVTTTDTPLAATDYYVLRQSIEGYNIADLQWGTASAATVTLSFWVRSSVTGTFGGSLNNDSARAYPFTYTINAANTFEQKTITIAGDTSGTWNKTNGLGINVEISLGAGSSLLATAGAWTTPSTSPPTSATGSTNLMATNGATFYITGVQLEKGSTATSFDYRPYGTELALCQRYYEQVAGFAGFFSNNSAHLRSTLKVPKRTQSAAISFSTSPMTVLAANAADAAGTTSTSGGVDQRLVAFNTDSAHIRLLNMSGTGVTNGFGCILTDSQYCIFDAEL